MVKILHSPGKPYILLTMDILHDLMYRNCGSILGHAGAILKGGSTNVMRTLNVYQGRLFIFLLGQVPLIQVLGPLWVFHQQYVRRTWGVRWNEIWEVRSVYHDSRLKLSLEVRPANRTGPTPPKQRNMHWIMLGIRMKFKVYSFIKGYWAPLASYSRAFWLCLDLCKQSLHHHWPKGFGNRRALFLPGLGEAPNSPKSKAGPVCTH